MSRVDPKSTKPSESFPDVRALLESIPYAVTIGVKPFFMGEEFTLILPYSQDNIGNPTLPALHGGCVGGMMEVCAIAQLIMSNPEGTYPKPIGINIDYLRRGKPVETYARAQIFKQGSRVANVRVRAWQENFDSPIATLHGHFLTT
ncbi:acyl-coenzyme A thioesterase PaaI-like protein [Litorimonas taeanensis]|uniref:Acyl-coenzyme A thioesterase PaaI-like protein n=1 Tax=Litorimonas taeanensis TaxID=568099 RepID=A0A420WFN8_9PROT|nr:PaaI family thioesterase [Litorimonas taeanensis]RKQ69775.1 acyl-coenzyme A thioesterase PaaI-like protein [Litorimonas taeanensis]